MCGHALGLKATAQLLSSTSVGLTLLRPFPSGLPLPQAGVKQMKSQIELGSGVFCRAVVPDTSHVFISIGLGFQLEVTLEEAGRVIDLQQAGLRAQVEACVDKAARIKANLKFVAEAIRELTAMPGV